MEGVLCFRIINVESFQVCELHPDGLNIEYKDMRLVFLDRAYYCFKVDLTIQVGFENVALWKTEVIRGQRMLELIDRKVLKRELKAHGQANNALVGQLAHSQVGKIIEHVQRWLMGADALGRYNFQLVYLAKELLGLSILQECRTLRLETQLVELLSELA
jgi:hypothetical protein